MSTGDEVDDDWDSTTDDDVDDDGDNTMGDDDDYNKTMAMSSSMPI